MIVVSPKSLLPVSLRSCLSNRCSKESCSLDLRGIKPSNRIIIDCDEYIKQRRITQKMCDYIVVHDLRGVSITVVEMKGGRLHAKDVAQQISNGAKLAEAITPTAGEHFQALLLRRKRINSIEYRTLKRYQVRFRNDRYPIVLARCGSRLR